MIDRQTAERIKDAADIVDVVSDYVHLSRRGSNYMGLCPFHNERTPSFSVNPRRNFCYCFSCHKGGSPVNFIMEKEGVSYHDALVYLAKKYNIPVVEKELNDEERAKVTEREGLMIASEFAMKQMEKNLTTPEGEEVGLSYFYQRKVTGEAMKAFHLGYALDSGNHLTEIMRREGFDVETLRKLGITGLNQQGKLYDKYRGRVIFPILNPSGKVVGFGGRDLKGGPAKYINSPESVLYRKNNELYGIYQAKGEIVRQNRCYLVEGYLDVISMWQSGVKNVVASSGTALTDGQIATIHRFTDNITVLYDGDAAGVKAALRGIDMLLDHKMKVTVVLLPDGMDPDDFAKGRNPGQLRKYLEENRTDLIRFKMKVLMDEASGDPGKKAAAVASVVESLAHIEEDVERSVYVHECSLIMKIDEASIVNSVEKARFAILEARRLERRRKALDRELNREPNDNRTQGGNATPRGHQGNGIASESPANGANGANGAGTNDANSANGALGANTTSGVSGYAADSALADSIKGYINRKQALDKYPLREVEKTLLTLIVRYGYMDFVYPKQHGAKNENTGDQNIEEAGEETPQISIVDYVAGELEIDDVNFTVPEYRKVMDELLDHFDIYDEKLPGVKAAVERKMHALREEKLEALRLEKGATASVDELMREEKKIDEEIEALRKGEVDDFMRHYPGDYLVSHEDDTIRNVANTMVNEPYVLSNIYQKNTQPPNPETPSRRVERALTELKNEILNMMLKDAMAEFNAHAGESEERDAEMLHKINVLMATRARVAKTIGDRIVSPRNLN